MLRQGENYSDGYLMKMINNALNWKISLMALGIGGFIFLLLFLNFSFMNDRIVFSGSQTYHKLYSTRLHFLEINFFSFLEALTPRCMPISLLCYSLNLEVGWETIVWTLSCLHLEVYKKIWCKMQIIDFSMTSFPYFL